jgi:NAD(P)H-nitrite reductase large subunit
MWVRRAVTGGQELRVTLSNGRREWSVSCDLLCTGAGLAPSTELARLLGCELDGRVVRVDRYQQTSVPRVFAAGEPTGNSGAEAALVEGTIAGLCAAGASGRAERHFSLRDRHLAFARAAGVAFAPRSELLRLPDDETIVCRCEDVPLGALRIGWSAREAKLATRAGMGPCQGRVCGPILEALFGAAPDTTRIPVFPTAVGVLADLDRERGPDRASAHPPIRPSAHSGNSPGAS